MKTIFLTVAIATVMLFHTAASANWDIRNLQQKPFNSLRDKVFFDTNNDSDKYQIGPEWGKKVVTPESLKKESKVFQGMALRTAKFGGFMGSGTAYYLGKFNGKHIMASNYHVIENADSCAQSRATFTMLNDKTFKCAEFLGSWSDVDFALVAIKVDPKDEHLLEGLGQNMAWDTEVYAGQKLLTIGHGVGHNPSQRLVANQDDDCMVYSQEGDIRFMKDPDDLNPADYLVWSFANGCDISHGDSGSAMVDRETGAMIGIIWTGRIPKDPKVLDENYLSEIFESNSPEVWKQLSYAAPATKIKEVLTEYLDTHQVPVDTATTIREILN